MLFSFGVNAQSFPFGELLDFLNKYDVDEVIEELVAQNYIHYKTEYVAEDDLNYITYHIMNEEVGYLSMVLQEDPDYEDLDALYYVTSNGDEFISLIQDLKRYNFLRSDDGSVDNYAEYTRDVTNYERGETWGSYYSAELDITLEVDAELVLYRIYLTYSGL